MHHDMDYLLQISNELHCLQALITKEEIDCHSTCPPEAIDKSQGLDGSTNELIKKCYSSFPKIFAISKRF
jgi:Fe-S-cluster-containing hydrogenase component 2